MHQPLNHDKRKGRTNEIMCTLFIDLISKIRINYYY